MDQTERVIHGTAFASAFKTAIAGYGTRSEETLREAREYAQQRADLTLAQYRLANPQSAVDPRLFTHDGTHEAMTEKSEIWAIRWLNNGFSHVVHRIKDYFSRGLTIKTELSTNYLLVSMPNSLATIVAQEHPELRVMPWVAPAKVEPEIGKAQPVKLTGILSDGPRFCAVCKEEQYQGGAGWVCGRGHYGADSITSATNTLRSEDL